MRKKIVAGNWKMNTDPAAARILARAVAQGVGTDDSVGVVLCPPFVCLTVVAEAIQGSAVALGAQNAYHETKGAYTGETSPTMLTAVGCRYVILGHSERRHVLGETDELINKKVLCALDCGLNVIACFGEKLEEREANQTEQVLGRQFDQSLKGVTADKAAQIVLAYEPVWAIGTGRNASPEQAQAAHVYLRKKAANQFGDDAAESMVIQYGGSVNPENAATLMSQPDVDGGLIGGASLDADKFLKIIEAAQQS